MHTLCSILRKMSFNSNETSDDPFHRFHINKYNSGEDRFGGYSSSGKDRFGGYSSYGEEGCFSGYSSSCFGGYSSSGSSRFGG